MKKINLKTNPLNQNNYNINKLTPDQIGSLVVYPVDYTHENTLSCDGFVLLIEDYPLLYSVIGKKFNTGSESETEFRIPDYNITGNFLQPGSNVGNKVEAGLPNISGYFTGGNNYTACITGGAFTFRGDTGAVNPGNGRSYGDKQYNFNASNSNSIYGKSSTVQPPSQIVHVCIRYK